MAMTPSYLRQHLYTILDQAAKTGTSPEIKRKGITLRIIADGEPDIFQRLKKHPDILLGDPDDIVHMNWVRHWHHDLP